MLAKLPHANCSASEFALNAYLWRPLVGNYATNETDNFTSHATWPTMTCKIVTWEAGRRFLWNFLSRSVLLILLGTLLLPPRDGSFSIVSILLLSESKDGWSWNVFWIQCTNNVGSLNGHNKPIFCIAYADGTFDYKWGRLKGNAPAYYYISSKRGIRPAFCSLAHKRINLWMLFAFNSDALPWLREHSSDDV